MGAVDTASPRALKLSTSGGAIRCWNPDTNGTTVHQGWDGWLMDFEYKSNADHAREEFRRPELILKLHDGEQEAHLAVRMDSYAFQQVVTSLANANLCQPITFRVWGYDSDKINEKTGQPQRNTGGFNLWQGNVQIAERHTNKNLNGMPEITEVMNEATLKKEKKGVDERMLFLRGILDNEIKPKLVEINQMGAWEEAPKHIGPSVPKARLALPETAGAQPAASKPPAVADMPPIGGDDDDLPF